jgi:hypothetical protein
MFLGLPRVLRFDPTGGGSALDNRVNTPDVQRIPGGQEDTRSELTINDLRALGTEQNLCYFVACGLGELKVFSQVVTNVLLSMLGFLDDAISNAFCDLRRVETLEHKIEEDGSQRSPRCSVSLSRQGTKSRFFRIPEMAFSSFSGVMEPFSKYLPLYKKPKRRGRSPCF